MIFVSSSTWPDIKWKNKAGEIEEYFEIKPGCKILADFRGFLDDIFQLEQDNLCFATPDFIQIILMKTYQSDQFRQAFTRPLPVFGIIRPVGKTS